MIIWILFLSNCNKDQNFLPFSFFVCPCLCQDLCCMSLSLAGSFCVSLGILVLLSFGIFFCVFLSPLGTFLYVFITCRIILCVFVSCGNFFVCLRLLRDLFRVSSSLVGSFINVFVSGVIFSVILVSYGFFSDVFVSCGIFLVCFCLLPGLFGMSLSLPFLFCIYLSLARPFLCVFVSCEMCPKCDREAPQAKTMRPVDEWWTKAQSSMRILHYHCHHSQWHWHQNQNKSKTMRPVEEWRTTAQSSLATS